jgi:hypothetical protein
MSCYILNLAMNHQLPHLFNTIIINIVTTNTKLISKLILIDLVMLDTIIHKNYSLHIFAQSFTKGLFSYIDISHSV